MTSWRGLLVFAAVCVALGACEWRREVVGTGCTIRNAQRNGELLRAQTEFLVPSVHIWHYGDTPPGDETRWKIERWTNDEDGHAEYYEFHNGKYDGFLMAVREVREVIFTKQSFLDSRQYTNLFKIEPPAFDGRDVFITSRYGDSVAVDGRKPHRTPVKLFLKQEANDFFKWRISCG